MSHNTANYIIKFGTPRMCLVIIYFENIIPNITAPSKWKMHTQMGVFLMRAILEIRIYSKTINQKIHFVISAHPINFPKIINLKQHSHLQVVITCHKIIYRTLRCIHIHIWNLIFLLGNIILNIC